jgi:hypothetical protein
MIISEINGLSVMFFVTTAISVSASSAFQLVSLTANKLTVDTYVITRKRLISWQLTCPLGARGGAVA